MKSFVFATTICFVVMAGSAAIIFAGAKTVGLQNEAAISIDPACLWPIIGGTMNPDAPPMPTSVPTAGCAPAGATITKDENGWVRLADEGADGARLHTGLRIAQRMKQTMLALHVYDSGGGSGVFSSLITGNFDVSQHRLTNIQSFGFGDRCNGGLAKTHLTENGRLRVTANMTPWDILMSPLGDMSFDDQWSLGAERYGAAFTEAPGCASCCSAVTREYEVDGAEMREIGLRYVASSGHRPTENTLGICLEEAVRDAAGADNLVTGSERDVLNTAIAACVSSVNSN